MNYDSSIDTHPSIDRHASADGRLHGADPAVPADDPASGAGPWAGRRVWIAAGAAFAVVVGLWFLSHRGDADKAAPVEQVPVVSVVVPGRATVGGEINVTGTLAARRTLPVGSVGEGGRVVSVLVDANDWVRKGQVLAVIDRSVQSQQEASQAAQVSVAEADARLAQSNLDRALKLVDRGFISKADVDRLTATRDAANARVQVARATLGQLRASSARLNILAPEAGLVLERNVEPGQVVSGGSGMLFSIAQGGEMELRAALGEDDLAALSVGVRAEVTPVGTDKRFAGQVWQLSPVIDTATRQGTARIALGWSPELRPGGFASARIRSGTLVAPILPDSAIQSDPKGSFVYVVDQSGRARRRAVTPGTVTAQGIVVAKGLDGSEQVVLRAGGFLNDGDKVEPRRVPVPPASTGQGG